MAMASIGRRPKNDEELARLVMEVTYIPLLPP
jgi:hypothetical protein